MQRLAVQVELNQCGPYALVNLTGCRLDVAVKAMWPEKKFTAEDLRFGRGFFCKDGKPIERGLTGIGWDFDDWCKLPHGGPPPVVAFGIALIARPKGGHWIAVKHGQVWDGMPGWDPHAPWTIDEYTVQMTSEGWRWMEYLDAWPRRRP